jgi:hypothetical protein
MKLTVGISLNPEDQEESKNQSAYQNVNYTLSGFKPVIKIDELGDMIYEWIKKQPKKK